MSNYTANTKIKTPIGEGVVQGPFAVVDGKGEAVVKGVIVRLAITDATRANLKTSNCLTPQAEKSGLWVFQEGELAL